MPFKARLILDMPRRAALNMAIDEMLMGSAKENPEALTLRFYSWERPAFSIGYFQKVSEVVERFGCRRNRTDVVRRMTGGGLVSHGKDLTVALILKNPNPFFSCDAKMSYVKIHEVLMRGLREGFPKIDFVDCKSVPAGKKTRDRVCFEEPVCSDLLLNGRKIAGGSQRRKDGVILHQSSILLPGDPRDWSAMIVQSFARHWDLDLEERPLTREELSRSEKISRERYQSPEWAYQAGEEPSRGLSLRFKRAFSFFSKHSGQL